MRRCRTSWAYAERTDKLVRELVLDDPAPFVPLHDEESAARRADYEAKTVRLAGRRYIVCRNHQEAEKDAADRASIVARSSGSSKRATRRWSAILAIAVT